MYITDGIIPAADDYGINVGAPHIIDNHDIRSVNKVLKTTIGLSENNVDLASSIVKVNELNKENHGDFPYQKNPCPTTVNLYQVLSVNDDDNIHMVKDGNVKIKDRRRQMASTSVRNLASHIAAVAYANFIPVVEKWNIPKGLPRGCIKLISMLKLVTGSHFRPIHPAFLLNEDCSSQYYCSGSIKNDSKNNGWSRVTTQSLKCRDRDSLWTADETKDTICKGLRVKFVCGGSAGGFIYPICILVSAMNQNELPSKDFKVTEIKGLSIIGNLDPRSQEIGYLCLIGANVSQRYFLIGSIMKLL